MIDKYERLNIGFDKVECIVHMSDIHIRLTKRHEEYKEAFNKLYKEIEKTPKDTIIVNSGDIFHSKIDLSPEAIQLASEFLKNLSDFRPTILIAGNHDCLLTNKTRLDSLTPIVENLAHDKLFYLKKTGLYGVGNILFNNMSVFDDVTHYANIKKLTKKIQNEFNVKVALFHGGIHGSMTDMGYLIENKIVPREFFDGHDIVMAGDIHRQQTFYIEKFMTLEEAETFDKLPESNVWEVLDDKESDLVHLRKKSSPIFRYPGSLIMQNHGESLLGHGFTLWDIPTKTHKHVEIPNDYGYFTIEIHDGKLITDIGRMPAKPKLRVKCKESVATEVKKVISEIRKTKTITDLVYLRIDGDDVQRHANLQTIANLNQIGNVGYQNKLIGEWLGEKYPEMDEATLKEIYEINKTLNANLSKDDQSKNIRWRPLKFEFSNMFSYGENNIIDFTSLSDVHGLFAANASGKSALLDAICFTIFDKSARAFKASHVINTQKMSFYGKFTFEINNVQYVIERKGTRDKKNNVKVDVNFVQLKDGEEIPLNAEARRSTNEVIRDYLGSYDDFVLTSLALQGNQGSFIDMGQTERKELLSLFMGLTLFDKLVAEANNRCKDLSGAIRIFNKEDNTKKIFDMANNVKLLENRLSELNEKKESITNTIKQLELNIKENEDKIVILENVPTDIISLNKEKDELIEKIKRENKIVNNIRAEIEKIKMEHDLLKDKLVTFGDVDLEQKFDDYNKAVKHRDILSTKLDKLKTLVGEKIKKLEHLDKHEYDPNCRFCMNNIFVKDAIATRESLKGDKERAHEMMDSVGVAEKAVDELFPFVGKFEQSREIKERKTTLAGMLARKELALNNSTTAIERMQNRLEKIDADIQLYERSHEVITTNHNYQEVIRKLNTELQKFNIDLKHVNSDHVAAYSKRVSLADQIQLINQQIEKVEKAEQEHAAYEYYIQAFGRDGIPYQIISDIVPKLEQDVNNILSQIVEFGVAIEAEGKNVNVYIKYEDRRWPLEMSSGMEKFICALAIRVALINISSLPRPNFLCVDEGMGALDSDNMAMVHALFDYLKSNFDFIIVISHLDAMRDMVDKQIEIKKINGFSSINHI